MKRVVRQELRAAGATASEIEDLTTIAMQLGKLQRVNRKHSARLSIVGLATVTSLVVLFLASEHATPGNPLYAIQMTSDSVVASIHPSYRGTIMMHRAATVNQLVHAQAPTKEVLTALSAYQEEAGTYQGMPTKNYDAINQCKASLLTASRDAAAPVKQAIDKVLASLDSA